MPNTRDADRFLNAVGCGLNIRERALANKLGDHVRLEHLAALIADESARQAITAIKSELNHACYVGQLKAERIPGEPGIPVQFGDTGPGPGGIYTNVVNAKPDDYIIHRDDARRYFQQLDAMPDEGTPLWCWLRGKRKDEAQALRGDQQDKADFQQMAVKRWKVSPEMRITGDDGIANAVGASYIRKYTERTVEKWAREVAPEGVKNKRGRPRKKISADPGK